MKEIDGKARTVRELLKGVKYSIDYYQREYKWTTKQIDELVADLTEMFMGDYEPTHDRSKVANYGHYFLGSIITTKKDGTSYIVDGQQRLTSLTLLLIHLRQLQADRADKVAVDELIVSEKYGQKSFNIDVPERRDIMTALYEGNVPEVIDQPESVMNIAARYADLEESFPGEIPPEALSYFTDWLLENVHLVEITAYSDDDAYTIFETMNDRGLSLTPTDMLKGYLLANIEDSAKRTAANALWRERTRDLLGVSKDAEADFFKSWLRSQYALKIRDRKKGAKPEDFDRMGTEFHRWLREASKTIGLSKSDEFYRFIQRDFDFYSRQYLRALDASTRLVAGLEPIFYNAQLGFTLQYLLLLAPLRPEDPEPLVLQKMNLAARFVDILLNWRVWNHRSIAYSTMQYSVFTYMRAIRGLAPVLLAARLRQELEAEDATFDSKDFVTLNVLNRHAIKRVLARMTSFIEAQSGIAPKYFDYVSDSGKNRYEVEHIWADHADRHAQEFAQESDFADYRNRVGGLLLLPKSFNASYGDLSYEDKLPHYFGQNLLAQSLNDQCYERNPGFLKFVKDSQLPFRPYAHFGKSEFAERGALYRALAKKIWNPNELIAEGK